MSSLLLEIVEGPGVGRQVRLDGALVIGRGSDADVVVEDDQVSRQHARVTVGDHGVVVEDLGSANGTFINHNELVGPGKLDPGDELLVGVTLMQLRTDREIETVPSAVRAVPPGLAAPEREPTYVPALPPEERATPPAQPRLTALLDVRVRHQARIAPLAALLLAAAVVAAYLIAGNDPGLLSG